MKTNSIVTTALIAAAISIILIAPAAAQRRARPARSIPAKVLTLTAADISLIVDVLTLTPDEKRQFLASDAERKRFLTDLREMFAAAQEAEALGYLAKPDLKLQTDLAKAFVIAQAYYNGPSKPAEPTAAEIDAFFREPATRPMFEAFVADYLKQSSRGASPLSADERSNLRTQYGKVMLGQRRGIKAGVDKARKVELNVLVQRARMLASAYAAGLEPQITPTQAEVTAYIEKHPELKAKAARAKIEGLLQRVRAGEDFAAIASAHTEDPSGRGNGGDLGWFRRGVMVKPFEDAAFSLKTGEVSGIIETQFGFHIIKLDERRGSGPSEEVHARHLLIGYGIPGAGAGTPLDQARAALRSQKRSAILGALALKRRINLPADFVQTP